MSLKNRFYGTILGLILGDAFGTPIDHLKDRPIPMEDLSTASKYDVPEGTWTDETSLFLTLLDVVVAEKVIQPKSVLNAYSQWFFNGKNTPDGYSQDVPKQLLDILVNYKKTGMAGYQPQGLLTDHVAYSLAQAGVLALCYHTEDAIKSSYEYSRIVHPSGVTAMGAMIITHLIHGALNGLHKDILLSPEYMAILELTPELLTVIQGSYKKRNDGRSDGLFLETDDTVGVLTMVLHGFYATNTFHAGLKMVTSQSLASGLVGSIYGALAGSYYGLTNLKDQWVLSLRCKKLIME